MTAVVVSVCSVQSVAFRQLVQHTEMTQRGVEHMLQGSGSFRRLFLETRRSSVVGATRNTM